MFSVVGGVTFVGMMADAPGDTEKRLGKVESDVGWMKVIGAAIIAGQVALFWQLYSLNAQVAAMDVKLDAIAASVGARLDAQDAEIAAMDAKLDTVLAAVAALAGN